ncbi:MAG: DegV family protein [Zhaonellaceae bacterium]
MKLAIVTDSTCDLGTDYLQQYGIYVLPLRVIYGDKEYYDGVDITPEEVYRRFPDEVPTTSMPGPGDVEKLFQELKNKGYDHVICLHISSGLSGTFNVVKMVAKSFPELKIEVIDSKALSLGLGFLVMKAVQLKNLGVKFNELVQQIEETRRKTKIFFVIKTLEYLKKGGRIGLIQASFGELLDIKPIVSINEEGKYYTYAKARGRKKSIQKLLDIFQELTAGKRITLAVMHGDAEEECISFLEKILKNSNTMITRHFTGQIGPGMVVHSGPGLLGFAFQE